MSFNLFKRSNGFYYVLYECQGRKRWKSTGCTRKPDALKALTRFKELLRDPVPSRTLSAFIPEYIDQVGSTLTPGTVQGYHATLNRFLSVFGDCALSHLTAKHVDTFKNGRLSQVSPATVNIELRTLRAAFTVAVCWGYLESNPFAQLQQVRVPDAAPVYLTHADFQKPLSLIAESWLKELVVFAVLTGVRIGEMLHLQWQDVDVTRKLITIQSTDTFRTKAGKRRTLHSSDVVHALLRSKYGRSASPFVFTRRGFPIGKSYLQHRSKFHVRQAVLDGRLHWHQAYSRIMVGPGWCNVVRSSETSRSSFEQGD